MLGFMRKHARSSFIKIVFWMIIVVFVFWGVGVMVAGGGSKVNVAATVDGEPITVQTYARAHERLERVYRELYRDAFSPQLVAQLNLGQRALDELVNDMLLKREAGRLGLQVTDDEVREAILNIPTFRDAGRFDRARYVEALRASQITPAEFEESQRETLLVTKLEGLLTDGLTASDLEVKNLYALEGEKVDVSFVKVPFSQFKDSSPVSDTEIADYYEKNKERFRTPERVTIAYIPYTVEKFEAEVPVSDDAVQAYYDAHQSDYEQPERLHLQQILFAVPAGADEAARSAVKAKADALLTEARAADTQQFGELAKKHSDDELSAGNGGDLGTVARGTLEAPVEQAAFALNVGEVSDPVTSSRGVHLIRVVEKIPGGAKPLAEVRDDILHELRSRGADEAARNALAADLEKARAGAALDDIAKAHGLTVTTTPPSSRGQPIAGVKSPTLLTTALALEPKAIDQVMDAEPPYYLFTVTERAESAIPPLEDVRASILETIRTEKMREAARAAADQLLTDARSAGTAAALLDAGKAKGYVVDSTGPFTRNDPIPKLAPAPIKDEVFALSATSPLGEKSFLAPDGAVVVALKERVPADESGLTDEKRQSLRDQAVARKKQDVLESYQQVLRQRAEISVNPDVLSRAG